MADVKVTQLPELTTPSDTDILPIVASPSSGATTKKITKANLLASTAPLVHTHTASAVTDFQTAVAANSTVTANTAHTARTDNPHATTKAQVGLGSADNTADASKPLSTAATTALAGKEPSITAGTTAQYYRGDKTFQTLDKAAVGLSAVVNVDATARANHTGTQSADSLVDGTTNKAFLATERTKLTGITTGATANATDVTLLNRANHTGTQSADTLVDGTTNKAFLATERTKLAGITAGASTSVTSATNKGAVYATGATTATSTAALTDGQLLVGSTAGNPAPATITAGTGITVTNAANSITIAAAATGATPRATLAFPTGGGSGNQISTAGAGTNVFGFAQGAYTHTVTGTGTSSSGGFSRRGSGWAGNAFRNMTGTFSGSIANNAGNGTVYIRFFYTGASGSISADDYTARQIGFVCTGGAVYAQVGNGSTGQSTALTGVNLVGNDVTITVAVIDGVSVKFSVDGTLAATFTTGLPDTTTQRKAVLLEKVEDGNGSGTALAIYGYAISYDA